MVLGVQTYQKCQGLKETCKLASYYSSLPSLQAVVEVAGLQGMLRAALVCGITHLGLSPLRPSEQLEMWREEFEGCS